MDAAEITSVATGSAVIMAMTGMVAIGAWRYRRPAKKDKAEQVP